MDNIIQLEKDTIIFSDMDEELYDIFIQSFPEIKWEKIIPKCTVRNINFNKLIEKIEKLLVKCRLCPLQCNINKLKACSRCGPPASKSRIFKSGIIYSEPFSPVYSLYFSGCNKSCSFCLYKKYYFDSEIFVPEEHAKKAKELWIEKKINGILFTGGNPDHSILSALKFLNVLNLNDIPVLWATNGFMTKQLFSVLKRFVSIFILSSHNIINSKNNIFYKEILRQNYVIYKTKNKILII